MHRKRVFENGTRLLLSPIEANRSFTALIMFGVGSRYESEPLAGASHFIEHMLFKGTEQRPKPSQISRILDAIGAQYNAFTNKNTTGYYIKAGKEHFSLSLEMLSDMLFHSVFDAEELKRERNVIVEEIKMYQENPAYHLDDLFESMMFGGSALGRDIAGTPKTVLSMEREALLAYKKSHYVPSNMVVSIAGNYPSDAEEVVKKLFIDPFHFEHPAPPAFEPFSFSSDAWPRIEVDHRKIEQVQLGLGFAAYNYFDPRLYALKLLSIILGGNMSSRLFQRVREDHGLAYSVNAGTSVYEDAGTFLITAGLDGKRLSHALELIVRELVTVVKQGVTEVELSEAKQFVRGKTELSLEDSERVAQWYANQQIFLPEPLSVEEKLSRFEAVTVDEVNAAAVDIFQRSRAGLALIGPVKNHRELSGMLDQLTP